MFHSVSTFNIIFAILNIVIFGAIVILSIVILFNARKNGCSWILSAFWFLVALFFLPPLGMLLYYTYGRKRKHIHDL